MKKQGGAQVAFLVLMGAGSIAGCLGAGGPKSASAARPAAGGDEEVVFEQIITARNGAGATVPAWIDRLAPLARAGAEKMGGGAPSRVVAGDIAQRAASSFGRDVVVYTMTADALSGLTFHPTMIRAHNLIVAVGVALMRAGGAGRYAIVIVSPEPGIQSVGN